MVTFYFYTAVVAEFIVFLLVEKIVRAINIDSGLQITPIVLLNTQSNVSHNQI